MLKNSTDYAPTYVLIAANVAVYAVTSYLSGSAYQTSDAVLNQYGQINYLVLPPYYQVWRLFTAMFVHANIAHIAGNMLFLFIFGLRAEKMFDLKEYLAVYFLSGLGGGLLTLLLGDVLFGPGMVSVGASGAIFGVVAAVTIFPRRAIGQSMLSGLMSLFLLFVLNLSSNVNYLAHLGGLAVGLLLGYFFGAARRQYRQVTYEFKFPSSYIFGLSSQEINEKPRAAS